VIGLLLSLAAATEPVPDEPLSLPMQMHQRFGLVTHARMAVQQGDLTTARAKAEQLVALEPPAGLTDPWRPYVVELKADAAKLGAASTLTVASEQVAAIAITCAECHRAKGGGPQVPPADAIDLSGDGRRPAGLDLLWLSLITGDDDAWTRGAAALAGEEKPDWPLVEATTPDDRAKAFAKLLAP